MTTGNHSESLANIPEQTFQAFLKRLEAAEVPADVVERLRKANAESQPLSEALIRSALFDDGETL